jgi:hypothetical protein
MTIDRGHSSRHGARSWAVLTLAGAVTALTAVAIASADGFAQHGARPDKGKTCRSSSGCVEATNSSSGPGVLGANTGTGFGILGESQASNAGVGGINSATSQGASGVYGQSLNGPGIKWVLDQQLEYLGAGFEYQFELAAVPLTALE